MGFRFRRSIRLGKGLRINLSKTGASLSAGRRGATVNFGPKGKKLTLGLPGSGVSYSTMHQNKRLHQVIPTATEASTATISGPNTVFRPLRIVVRILGLVVLGAAALGVMSAAFGL